jgi:sugar transferase (PEP-CTERM/EpsH1 system associated)
VTPLIAHLVFRFDYGGLENGIVNLVNRLPRERFRHTIVCLEGYNEDYARRLERKDVRVISIGKRPGKDLSSYLRMWRVLRKLQPTITHSRNLGTLDQQWIAMAAGVPIRVHGEHGWSPDDPQGLKPSNLRLRRLCKPAIHGYVAMSQHIERWLVERVGVEPPRVRQLYSGVDSARFQPDASDAADAPWRAGRGHGTDHDPCIVIGTIGRLDPIKNHAAVLRAFTRARGAPGGDRLRLVIVGEGVERPRLEQIIAEAGLGQTVWLTGARADTPHLLRTFDVFVLPSLNEGISNTILEAMASQLPVLASKVGGNPELVVEGLTGALYSASDEQALAALIGRYAGDERLRRIQGEQGRERAVRHFSLEAMVRRYEQFYDDLMSSSPFPARAGEGPAEGLK